MQHNKITKIVMMTLLSTSLFASAGALHDSVAKKEQKALMKNHVKGEAAAKAEVEESHSKLLFKTKEKEFKQTFEKESKAEAKKRLLQ